MVEVDFKVVIVGLLCITAICITLILCDKIDSSGVSIFVGVIGLAIGVIIPSPKVDNKRGVFRYG